MFFSPDKINDSEAISAFIKARLDIIINGNP
jgi:hypothetical protein